MSVGDVCRPDFSDNLMTFYSVLFCVCVCVCVCACVCGEKVRKKERERECV